MENIRNIRIFDTTLRDGEQAPGCSMNTGEKIEVARRLESLGVDVIEAGFPISSPGDLESVRRIAAEIHGATVCALCRSLEKDIDAGREALEKAVHPRIHVFIATSPIHMEYKLKMSPDAVLEQAVAAVKYAKKFCSDVEFSAEDASRSDCNFVARVFSAVIEAGATVVNFPDTTGYAMPDEFAHLVTRVREKTGGIEKVDFSVHVHNDLGLAVANSLAAIRSGANQVECTINGIGERAGNASLEEIVMALKTRRDFWKADTGIDTTQIYPVSRLVQKVTGVKVQPNKAIVGENAFAHEAGIHQHGVMANRATYEIMTPESLGISRNEMVLGKHSGRHAFVERLTQLGFHPDEAAIEKAFAEFKILADKKKTVSDRDIEALLTGWAAAPPETWKLDSWVSIAGSAITSQSTIKLSRKNGSADRETHEVSHFGDGCIDAAFFAVNEITGLDVQLESFELGAITGDADAQGEALVKVRCGDGHWNGRGVSTNIVESGIKAYVAAINAMEADRTPEKKK